MCALLRLGGVITECQHESSSKRPHPPSPPRCGPFDPCAHVPSADLRLVRRSAPGTCAHLTGLFHISAGSVPGVRSRRSADGARTVRPRGSSDNGSYARSAPRRAAHERIANHMRWELDGLWLAVRSNAAACLLKRRREEEAHQPLCALECRTFSPLLPFSFCFDK